MKDPFYTYGPPELCVWEVESLGRDKGIFWFQTTDRAFARKLAKRNDTRRVEMTGWNHFRQTYAMVGTWRKAKRIIDRYILSAGDSILAQNVPQKALHLADRVVTAGLSLVTPDRILARSRPQDASNLVSRIRVPTVSDRELIATETSREAAELELVEV